MSREKCFFPANVHSGQNLRLPAEIPFPALCAGDAAPAVSALLLLGLGFWLVAPLRGGAHLPTLCVNSAHRGLALPPAGMNAERSKTRHTAERCDESKSTSRTKSMAEEGRTSESPTPEFSRHLN